MERNRDGKGEFIVTGFNQQKLQCYSVTNGSERENRREDGKHTQERGRSIAGGGMVRLVDTLRPPLRISRDLVITS